MRNRSGRGVTGLATGLIDLEQSPAACTPDNWLFWRHGSRHGKRRSLALNFSDHVAVNLKVPGAFHQPRDGLRKIGERLWWRSLQGRRS